jgi:hypothetical protein
VLLSKNLVKDSANRKMEEAESSYSGPKSRYFRSKYKKELLQYGKNYSIIVPYHGGGRRK